MFTAHSESLGGITWDGDFTGSPVMIALITQAIEDGETVPTIEVGPEPQAASEPEWVAWWTAVYALRHFDLEWSPPASVMPLEERAIPPTAVA